MNPVGVEPTTNVIRKVGSQHCVYSESGKSLGGCGSLAKAKKRLQQVEYFKHVNNQRQLHPEVRILLDIVANGIYGQALGAIGKQAFKDVKRLGGVAGVAKAGVRKAAAFTRRRPKTALAATGIGAYTLGKRKGRKQVQNALFTKKRLKQAGGFATGAAGGFGGAAAGAAIGQAAIPIPVVGGLVGGAIGAGAGTWGANKVAKKFGGKTAEKASGWGGLAGSLASPGMVRGVVKGGAKLLGRGAATGATKAVARTGLRAPSRMARIGRSLKAGRYGAASRMAGVGVAKGAARMGTETTAYQGTQAGLDKTFAGKQRKPRIPRATMNAWTDEARRKSIEKRRAHSQEPHMSTATKIGIVTGAGTGALGYKLVEPDIDRGVKAIRTATRDRGVRSLKALGKLLLRIRKV
jgi:hypothetical protein